MFKKIRKLKQLNKKLETFEPYETDSSGRRLIRLHVNDVDSFLAPLSVDGVPVISDDTAYLLNFYLKNMATDSDEELCFQITGHDLSDKEKEIYKKAIKNYYKEEFVDVNDKLKDNIHDAIYMFIAGTILFLGKFFITKYIGDHTFLEFLEIIVWAILWEGIDLLVFRRPELREKQIRNLKILEAEIIFKEKPQPEDEIPFEIQKLEDN